jgi:acyl-CoA synthetase (AMP-forming)/AMP-acid ligase II
MPLDRLVAAVRQRTPDKNGLWFGDQHWTYAALDETSDRVAAALAAAGVRVALFLPNCPELVFSYLACFKLGAVSVPLNYRYRAAHQPLDFLPERLPRHTSAMPPRARNASKR